MTRDEAINKLEHIIISHVGREEIDETCFEVMKYLAAKKPVEPRRVNRYIDFDGEGEPFTPETYDCGNCEKELPWKANYCPRVRKSGEVGMTDNNKLRDTIMDMEASLSTNLSGYSMRHYGADIHGITRETLKNAIEALKAQEPVSPNKEQHQCNKCEFYQGVHNVMGHAPCSFWDIGGVMWDDYCSHFSHDENDLGNM